MRAAERRREAEDVIKEIPESAATSALQSQGWLTVEGRSGGPMPLAGDLIRIGRQEDNDIRLADRSVHRHHAVIERTADEAFMIKDVSGQDGSGVRINGEPKAEGPTCRRRCDRAWPGEPEVRECTGLNRRSFCCRRVDMDDNRGPTGAAPSTASIAPPDLTDRR